MSKKISWDQYKSGLQNLYVSKLSRAELEYLNKADLDDADDPRVQNFVLLSLLIPYVIFESCSDMALEEVRQFMESAQCRPP